MAPNNEVKRKFTPQTFELRRKTLLEQVEHSSAQVIAVLAPSGYGKTTLVRQILQSWPGTVGWIALTEEHTDYRNLATKLLLVGGLGGSTEVLTQSSLGGLAKSIGHQLKAIDGMLALVMDEVQTVTVETSQFLERLVGELDERHRVILAGYEADHLPLALWVSQGKALLVTGQALAFSPDETERYLRSRKYAGDPQQAYTHSEGWPAVLSLIASGATPGLEPSDLVRNMLGLLPEHFRRDIAQAAITPVWTEERLSKLGAQLKPGWLQAVRQIGLPMTVLGRGKYRPHTLLLEALEEELSLFPELHSTLHIAAAEVERKEGYPLNALQHLELAGATEEALDLAEELVQGYIQRWQLPMADRIFERFGESFLTPRMQALQARTFIETKKYMQAEAILQQLVSRSNVPAPAYHAMGMLHAYQGHGKQALEWAEQGLKLEVSPSERADLLSIKSWALMDLGQVEESRMIGEELVAQFRQQGNLLLVGKTLDQLTTVYGVMGDYASGIHAAEQAIQIFDELGWIERTLSIQSNLAFTYVVLGQLEKALELLEHAIPVAQREKHMTEALLRSCTGDLWLQYGQPQKAIEELEAALRTCEGHPLGHLKQEIRLYLCDAARLAGGQDLLQRYLTEARANAVEQESPHLMGMLSFQEALEAMQDGDLTRADPLFIQANQAHYNPLYPIRALAYRAEIARQQGVLTKKHIDELIGRIGAIGNKRLLGVDARKLAPLYRTCVHKRWYGTWFSPWLDEALSPSLVEPKILLELRLLGRREVRVAGVPVELGLRRSVELLAFLTLKGKSTREGLLNALWNGSDDPRHREVLKKAVQRLRLSLSEAGQLDFDPVPYVGGKYQLAQQFEVHLDALELAEALKRKDEVLLQMTMDSYRGVFCEEAEGEWVYEYQDRYQEHALQVAVKLGGILERSNIEEATKTYWWAVETDGLYSPAYEALEQLYLKQGDTAGLELLRKAREWGLNN